MTTLYDRAIQAMEDKIVEVQAQEFEKAAAALRNRMDIFDKERQMFRELTETLLGEALELSMDPETGEPIPAPVSDLVGLTIEYTNGLWDHKRGCWENVEYVHAKPHMWKLRAVSSVYHPNTYFPVKSLADLGEALVAAQDEQDRLDEQASQGGAESAQPAHTPQHCEHYEMVEPVELNRIERPFMVIGSPFADPDTSIVYVLIQYTDASVADYMA